MTRPPNGGPCRRFPSGRLVLFLYLTGGLLGNAAFLADQYLRSRSEWPRARLRSRLA